MRAHTPDGGQAFPTPARKEDKFSGHAYTEFFPASPGMTLRDYFAAQIAAGLVVGCAGMLGDNFSAYAKGYCNTTLANRAYALADAMLAERAKASA